MISLGKINLNKVARQVAKLEAGKIEISIAQIKEVIKDLFFILSEYKSSEVLEAIERVFERYN